MMDEWKVLLEQQAEPFEQRAVQKYGQLVTEARKKKFRNDWTKRALQSLNRYARDEWPIEKEAITSGLEACFRVRCLRNLSLIVRRLRQCRADSRAVGRQVESRKTSRKTSPKEVGRQVGRQVRREVGRQVEEKSEDKSEEVEEESKRSRKTSRMIAPSRPPVAPKSSQRSKLLRLMCRRLIRWLRIRRLQRSAPRRRLLPPAMMRTTNEIELLGPDPLRLLRVAQDGRARACTI